MSSNLCWEPVQPKKHKTLSCAMKFLLREVYEHSALTDGGVTLSPADSPFLRGALAATNSEEIKADIKTLLEAIERYGEVKVWEQY